MQVFPIGDLDAEAATPRTPRYRRQSPVTAIRFGTTLAAVAGATERAMIIGVPDDTAHTTGMVNVIPLERHPAVLEAGHRCVPAGGASRFG